MGGTYSFSNLRSCYHRLLPALLSFTNFNRHVNMTRTVGREAVRVETLFL